MEREVLRLLDEADAKLRERIESIQNPTYDMKRHKLAKIRETVQEAITELLLID